MASAFAAADLGHEWYGADTAVSHDERCQNARLIAAAPELLAALKGMVARFYRQGGALLSVAAVARAKAAIAKAEGP